MRHLSFWLVLCTVLWANSAIAAEYHGKNIDGRRFAGKVYSYETGGVFDVKVEFQNKKAVLYFVNGGQQTLRLKRAEIKDPRNILGWSKGFLNIGGIFSVSAADDSSSNTEPPRPRPFEGFWRISLDDADLR
jgi:hypothetical protein